LHLHLRAEGLARRLLRILLVLIALVLAAGGAYLGVLQINGNFHVVIADELYRSAQLTPAEIAVYTKRYGIRTIVNLRGKGEGSQWYDDEVVAAKGLGVAHDDFRMSSGQVLSLAKARQLVALLAKAEKPILIHCKSGADRSGLAAALYLAAVKKESQREAGRQISFWYGHLSVPFLPDYAIDDSFGKLAPRLARSRIALAPTGAGNGPLARGD
jgi:protein tyrosine/serine phosphatase